MTRISLTFAARALTGGALLFCITACIKSGTDQGPKLPQLPEATAKGIVMDTDGNPVSNAYITVDSITTFTDQRGRFRLDNKPAQPKIVHVDARLTSVSAPGGGILDTLNVAGSFDAVNGVFERPIVMPNFAKGVSASISVNNGAILSGTLTDPSTGVQLVLDGAIATIPGTSATQATLRFVSIPPEAVTAALRVVGQERAGIAYFAISPSNLQFTSAPVARIADTTFGVAAAISASKAVSPELDYLDPSAGTWTVNGAATISGGFVRSSLVQDGGIYCLSVALPAQRRTIVTARLLDQNLEPLTSAIALARDGRASITDNNGLLAIPDVTAADANDTPFLVNLQMFSTPYLTQHAMRADLITPQVGPGLTTDFSDRPIATVPAGRVRVLPVFEGEKRANARVGAASMFGGRFEDSQFATKQGAEFWDVPVGYYEVTAVDDFNDANALRAAARGNVKIAGGSADIQLFMQRSRLRTPKQRGRVREVAVRSTSLTPVFNSFHMLGLNGSNNQLGFSPYGVGGFGRALPGQVLTTAAQEVSASAFGTSGLDLYRRRAFHSQLTEASLRRSPVSAFLNYLPKGYDRASAFFGNVTQNTDPNAVVPVNGAYATEVRARHTASFEKRLSVVMGAEQEPGASLAQVARRPSTQDAAFEVLAPVGHATIALVERDAANAEANIGNITKVGFLSEEASFFAERKQRDVALALASNTTISTTLAGALAPQGISLVLEDSAGRGIDIGAQSDFTYNGGNGALQVRVPSGAGGRVAIVATASGATANGSSFEAAAANVTGETAPFQFLTIPELNAPAPPVGEKIQIAPTTTGISWSADPAASEIVIQLARVATQTESDGKIVKQDSEWSVRLPGTETNFIFPTTPSSHKNVPVPVFFESGATYLLTIEARQYLQYEERVAGTSPDAGTAGYFRVRAVSRTSVEVKIP